MHFHGMAAFFEIWPLMTIHGLRGSDYMTTTYINLVLQHIAKIIAKPPA